MTTNPHHTSTFLASMDGQVHLALPIGTDGRMPALCGDVPAEEIDASEVTISRTLCAECAAEYMTLRRDQQDNWTIAMLLVRHEIGDYLIRTPGMAKTLSDVPEAMELLVVFEGVARSAAEFTLDEGRDRPDTIHMIDHMIGQNLPSSDDLNWCLAQREARRALQQILSVLDEDDEQENAPTPSTSSDPSTWTVPWSATIAPLGVTSENGRIIRPDCTLEVCEDATLSDEAGTVLGSVMLLISGDGYVHASGMCSPDADLDGPPIFECVDMDGLYEGKVFAFSRITLRRVMVGGRVRVPAWSDSELTFDRS